MDQDKKTEFLKKMNKLKQAYIPYLNEWRLELENALYNVAKWTIDDTTALRFTIHKLTGTGTTYGFPNITDAARSLEYKIAFANNAFSTGGENPNANSFIISELKHLIHICEEIYFKEVANAEYEDEDEILKNLDFNEADVSKKTIMVVDDNAIIRHSLEAALKSSGFNTVLAADGDEVLLLMQKKVPDLLILDRMMPHLDGLAVVKVMRKSTKLEKIPVIFLTALSSPEHILEAEKLGAIDYVTKPFDTEEFIMRCIRALELQK